LIRRCNREKESAISNQLKEISDKIDDRAKRYRLSGTLKLRGHKFENSRKEESSIGNKSEKSEEIKSCFELPTKFSAR
jgi:hypothetical protein